MMMMMILNLNIIHISSFRVTAVLVKEVDPSRAGAQTALQRSGYRVSRAGLGAPLPGGPGVLGLGVGP